jgi:hypothetical protein
MINFLSAENKKEEDKKEEDKIDILSDNTDDEIETNDIFDPIIFISKKNNKRLCVIRNFKSYYNVKITFQSNITKIIYEPKNLKNVIFSAINSKLNTNNNDEKFIIDEDDLNYNLKEKSLDIELISNEKNVHQLNDIILIVEEKPKINTLILS